MSAAQKPEPGTHVATVEQPARPYALRSPIAELLQSDAAMAVIVPLIPHGVDYNRVVSEVYRAGTNDPKILKCTPKSIIDAVATVVQTGLTVGKTIYLVPQRTKVSARGEADRYEDRLQAWTSYVGDIELVVRSGAARHVDGVAVYENDRIEVTLGSNPDVVHVPSMDTAKRGRLKGAYSIAYLNGLGTLKKVTWMPLADVEKIRAKSKSWGPDKIAECPDWYAIKSAIHRNCKTLPKNERLARVIALFDRQEAEDRGDASFDELPIDLNPVNEIRNPRQAQLPPRVSPTDPYDVSARGEVQPQEAVRVTPEPRTEAQRAAAAAAAQGDDPFGPTAPLNETDAENARDRDWTPPSAAGEEAAPRSALELFPMPFGPTVGKPMGDLSTPDLESAYRWALKNKHHPLFVEKAAQLLDDRRNGDAKEPSQTGED